MQTGKLNEESFSHVLRGISQRRKQGTLELTLGEETRFVYFISGKIVEVRDEGVNEHQEVAELLLNSGLIDEVPEGFESYAELFEALDGAVPKTVFERVILHRVLDKLYDVDLKKGGFFSFNVQMVDVDRDHTPSLSVGSFLLDLVSLDDQKKQIDDKLGSQAIQKSDSGPAGTLNDEEWLVLEYLERPMSLAQLKRRTMLSTFALQEAVLDLLDKKGIVLGEESSIEDLEEFLKQERSPKKSKEKKASKEKGSATPKDGVDEQEAPKVKIEPPSEAWSLAFSVLILLVSLVLPAFLWTKIWANF